MNIKKIIKKMFFSIFILIFLGLTNSSHAGWLDLPNNIDAKGIINQFIGQYSPNQSVNYQSNITNLLDMFDKRQISSEVKDNYTNSLVSNINFELSSKYGDTYGYAQLSFTPSEVQTLKSINLYDALINFKYIELDYDFLKGAGMLSPNGYNYFKNTLYPLFEAKISIPTKKYTEPKIISVGGFNALLVPKKYIDLEIFFNDYYPKIKDQVIPFGVMGNNLLFVSLPQQSSFKGQIASSLTLSKGGTDYLIKGKIKYPKELSTCMNKVNGNTVITLNDLSLQLSSIPECKSILTSISLDCVGQPEYVGNFNKNSLNQFIGVYGLEQQDGFFVIAIIKREFQRNLLKALPSSTYNAASQCGYNLFMQDTLTTNVNGYKDFNKGAKKVVYSSRDQGWNTTSCASQCNVVNGTLQCDSSSSSLVNACNLVNMPLDLVNNGSDFGINLGLFQSGSLNQNLLVGFKDNTNNVQNYWTIGNKIGNAAINKGVSTKTDLGLSFNNSRSENGVSINNYWNNYLSLYQDINGNKIINQKIRNSSIYNYQITGPNTGNYITTLLSSTKYLPIGGAPSYNKSNFNRYNKLFLFSSGSSISDISQVSFLDLVYNVPTKYYVFSKKTTVDNIQTLNLQQTLDLEGYDFFNKDIGLNVYGVGDNLKGFDFTFSGELDPSNNKYFGDPKKTQTNKIDFDTLRYNYGTLQGGLGIYKEIKHLKLVYDNSKDMYVYKDSDVAPFTAFESNNIYIGGFLGGIVKDCSLINFVADDLKGCSHGGLQPINIDNDSIDIGKGFTNWPEWIYSSGSELRIYNNKVTKDNIGNYKVNLEEIFYNNQLQFCNKINQTVPYYTAHNSIPTALLSTGLGNTYKGYSVDNTKGISLIFMQGDYKYIYGFTGVDWFDKKYNLTQTIVDINNTITCQ